MGQVDLFVLGSKILSSWQIHLLPAHVALADLQSKQKVQQWQLAPGFTSVCAVTVYVEPQTRGTNHNLNQVGGPKAGLCGFGSGT